MSTTVTYKGETLTTVSNDTATLETSGTWLEDDITLTDVSSGGTMQAKTNISPTTSSQTITPDVGYDGLSSVQINAMPTGTAGTPTATKGTVSNHSVSVTPSVTNTTGYITGSTISGTAVTVSASELDSGSKSITANGNSQDVVGYASVDVNVPNSYSASDEGKVVSNGALVAQTSDTVTTNDTYDTTLINSLTVNVSGGGGDTTEWKASRASFPAFGGIYNGKNLTLDFDNQVASLPSINYMGMNDGANGKLTLKNLSSSLTSSNMNLSDFLRQAPAFKEIDLGGAAPASMTRWLYQWNYSANSKFATTPITITNLSLDNLSSQNTSFNSGGTYAQSVDIYFLGYLKNTINLSAWVMLNADSWNRLIERLYDYSGGDTHTLTVGNTILSLIDSAHQAIATARGWTLA